MSISPRAARTAAILALSFLAPAAGCGRRSPPAARDDFPAFTDVAEESGILFTHDNGFDGTRYRVVETVNGGLALLDFDRDGWLDIYFTNGRKIDPGPDPPRDALYRNEGGGRFADATARARLGDERLSLGCAAADFDGDGDPDLYVTNEGGNRLYRNEGDGTFTDIAEAAGVASGTMDSGSAFLDMDRDGDLDLYVASYAIDDTDYRPCPQRAVPGYCPPRNYRPPPHKLFANLGNGGFRDVSRESGILDVEGGGRGLGVIAADFNDDGHPDIYVANDMNANFMFLGDGKGRFREVAIENGTAFGDQGEELGSMGVDAQDYDGDGRLDLCVTNYQNQINNLYRASGKDGYEDMARLAGVADRVLADVAWGVGLVDLDGDGWRDLFIANGHLNPRTREMDESTSFPQPKRVFRNLGGGRFADVAARAGAAVTAPRVSRGAAFGDLDNDGDLDIAVLELNGRPQLLRNEAGGVNAWCLLELRGTGLNRDAIGARVRLTAGGRTQIGERRSSDSYLSANDPRLHFGLGGASRIDRLEVRWPDGAVEAHEGLPVRRLLIITRGQRDVEARELAPGGRGAR
jgi:hypothetical protein